MLRFQSSKRLIFKSQTELFSYLSDLKNYDKVFVSNKVKKLESDTNLINFELENIGKVSLKLIDTHRFDFVKLANKEIKPFKFYIMFFIEKLSDSECNVQTIMEAYINPFMKMMVEKPLLVFLNELNSNI